MQFDELIRQARSYRRFSQKPLPEGFLKKIVDYARLSPSSGNMQFLKFMTIEEKVNRDAVFPILKWAKSLTDWEGPIEAERPTGYIAILLDKTIHSHPICDQGVVAQSMVLGAAAEGVGSCMIGTFVKKALSDVLELDEHLEPCLILAFGYPGEIVILEDLEATGATRYYRDSNGDHHVPKRTLEELLVKEK